MCWFFHTSPMTFAHPKMADRPILKIVGGRHPVIEKLLTKDPFIENDLILRGDQPAVLIVTGPNIAGKSFFFSAGRTLYR